MSGIKNLIAPFQRVLINKKMCPACTAPLDKTKRYDFDGNADMVICNCRRMFVFDKTTNTYRRATLREAEMFARGK